MSYAMLILVHFRYVCNKGKKIALGFGVSALHCLSSSGLTSNSYFQKIMSFANRRDMQLKFPHMCAKAHVNNHMYTDTHVHIYAHTYMHALSCLVTLKDLS